MIAVSSLYLSSDVTINLLNTELPPTTKTASTIPHKPTCTTCKVVDDDETHLQHTLYPTPNNELLLPSSECPTGSPKDPSSSSFFSSCIKSKPPSLINNLNSLHNWTHPERLDEVAPTLIQTLLDLEETPALDLLNQLKEPRTII